MEVVETLDIETVEIECSGHTANPVISLEQYRLVAITSQLIGDRKTHRAGTENRNTFTGHRQKSRAT
jgi:hypothetical protein